MTITRMAAVAGLLLALTGCETMHAKVSRPEGLPPSAALPAGTDLKVVDVRVAVPGSLVVSEVESIYPASTDIVWHGDERGDRRAQVAALIENAAARAVARDEGTVPAVAELVVERFHGITDKTHRSVGGMYTIRFRLAYLDAATGQPLGPPRVLHADLKQPTEGSFATTDKPHVIAHLAQFLSREFAAPVGQGG